MSSFHDEYEKSINEVDFMKKFIDKFVPILLGVVFAGGAYGYYHKFIAWDNIALMYLFAVLILFSFAGICAFFGKNQKSIRAKFCSGLAIGAVILFGLTFLVNNMIFGAGENELSISIILSVFTVITAALLISYYIKIRREVGISHCAVFSAASAAIGVAGILTVGQRVISVLMVLCMTISLSGNQVSANTDNLTYTELEQVSKKPRDYGTFAPQANDIFVDVTAENGDGTQGAPCNSIVLAEEKAKALRASGVDEKITVWISEGTYILEDTLVFDDTDADNVLYRAMPNAEVCFSGAVSIDKWTEDTQNGVKVFTADIPDKTDFDAVTKNGTTLPKTRYPETGYLTIETEDHSDAMFTPENTPWGETLGDMAFVGNNSYNPEAMKNVDNIVARVLHKWVNDLHYLKAYDNETNKYYTVEPFSMTVRAGDRYYFENIYEELNAPGEWYFDKSAGKLYYVPQADDTVENTVLNACVNDKLVLMRDVHDIAFFGITFCDTNFSCPVVDKDSSVMLNNFGARFPQAEYDTEAAVEITNAEKIDFTNCNFYNIGNSAIQYNKYVKNASVKSCHFKNIGGTGVYIDGLNSEIDAEITENIHVLDCKIESYGRNWQSAIGVFITHARNCTIQNNEITDGYYTAISVGWLWGYDYSVTGGIAIKDNLIYNIGQGWLSDMGGIYTLGEQTGTVISGNVIHDVAADPNEGGYGGWGLYFDEGSANILAENNLIYNCGSQSFHQHYGKNNLLRNNIFALSDEGQIRCSRNEEHNEFHLEGNIILADASLTYVDLQEGKFTDSGNIYWDLTNGMYVVGSKALDKKLTNILYDSAAKKLGFYTNAVFVNPQFRDPRNGDFTIADGNDAIEKIGFTPWNYNNAGTISDFIEVQ